MARNIVATETVWVGSFDRAMRPRYRPRLEPAAVLLPRVTLVTRARSITSGGSADLPDREPIDIEYNSGNAALEELLLSIDRPGDFCAHGKLFAPMPRLEVEGVGLLSFPVPDMQVRALIAVAERAPYGKGPDTLVDTSVRDCRQIDAARIRVSGGAWGDTFQRILDSAAAGLGCRTDWLDARLYKLLVYEPGGFFATHRDTEKADGMIATLTISLPVAGGGGELVVRHREREAAIDMNAEEPSELAFAAFYADCAHEVRPVREGHRLSLIFNLCVRAGDEDTPRQAPDFSSHADRIAARLTAWRDRPDASDKLVWLLDQTTARRACRSTP